MDALALGAEESQQLGRLVAGAADPVRQAGVELRGLAGAELESVLAVRPVSVASSASVLPRR